MKEILTDKIIDANEIDSEGIVAKKVTLTNRHLYELAFVEQALKYSGLKISSSQLIRLCLDSSLAAIHDNLLSTLTRKKVVS